MLAPQWSQLTIGPLLRRESDWRFYTQQMLPAFGEIRGFRKLHALLTCRHVPESEHFKMHRGAPERSLFVFEGPSDHFSSLIGHAARLKQALIEAMHPQSFALSDAIAVPPIGIHVRRGDFAEVAWADLKTRGNVRTPISWFVEALNQVRRIIGWPVPALVATDGPPEDIAGLLREEHVSLVNTGSAVAELLLLSRTKVLIGSGGSTFTAWASFLGGMPTVTVPGQSLTWYGLGTEPGKYVGELATDVDPHPDFVSSLAGLRRDTSRTTSALRL